MKQFAGWFLAWWCITTTCIFSKPVLQETPLLDLYAPKSVANSSPSEAHSCSLLEAPTRGLNQNKRKRMGGWDDAEASLSGQSSLSSLEEVPTKKVKSLAEPTHHENFGFAFHHKTTGIGSSESTERSDTLTRMVRVEFVNFQVSIHNLLSKLDQGAQFLKARQTETPNIRLLDYGWPSEQLTMTIRWIVSDQALSVNSLYDSFLSLESCMTHLNMFLMEENYDKCTAIESTNLLLFWLQDQIFSHTGGTPILGIVESGKNEKKDLKSMQKILVNYFVSYKRNKKGAKDLAMAIIDLWYLEKYPKIWHKVIGPLNRDLARKEAFLQDEILLTKIRKDIKKNYHRFF